jgi:two-component system chemotaxis response regulator CheB
MAGKRKIRVLVVDDSASFRAALALALATDPEIEVVGQAADGKNAIALAARLRPDVITMDVMMPILDGIEASKLILAQQPVPIVLMSTMARRQEQRMALNALRLGIVDITNKPVLTGAAARDGVQQVLRVVKAAAGVNVPALPAQPNGAAGATAKARPIELIAIAAATGGPPALERVLAPLPAHAPPVVIAQQLAPSFARGFADWLATAVGRPVVSVSEPQPLHPGTLYIAAEKRHIRVRLGFASPVATVGSEPAPDIDGLFHSVASAYGSAALGIVLTGMGDDGATGLKALRMAGGWTIGQDRESSMVFGMARVASEMNALCEVLPLDNIAARVIHLLPGRRAPRR